MAIGRLGRILGSGLGRARRGTTKEGLMAGAGVLTLGGVAAAGLGRETIDRTSELMTGDPRTARYAMQSSIVSGVNRRRHDRVHAPHSYQYGRPVNPQATGDITLGLYNLRKG